MSQDRAQSDRVHLQRLLDVHLAALAFLSTLLFGMREQSLVLPAAMLAAVVASVWLTDITRRFHLGPRVSNLAAFAAVAISVWRFLVSSQPDETTTLVEILVCVEMTLLFQEKDARTRWDLASLSLVAVLVAAAADQGIVFGVILVSYALVGISALGLMFLYREQALAAQAGSAQAGSAATAVGPFPGADECPRTDWVRLRKIALAALFVGPVALFLRYAPSPRRRQAKALTSTPGSPRADRPPTGRQPLLHGSPPRPVGRDGVGWDLWTRLAVAALATLLVAPVAFVLLPRFGRFNISLPRLRHVDWQDSDEEGGRMVGFSDSVTLGELGELIESDQEVLQIQFVDQATRQLYPVQGDVYLRGAVLTRYESGKWGCDKLGTGPARALERDESLPGVELVRQRIQINPMDRRELFCVWPFVVTRGTARVWYDPEYERLRRLPSSRNQHFFYQFGTTAFVDGEQARLIPVRSRPGDGAVNPQPLLQMPSRAVPRLAALARQWLDESGISQQDRLGRAQVLEEQLRKSGQFQHSLVGQARDTALDPIEDFVANHKSGNCEYFATALALMLRSQGIPARMVVGYKSDEYDYVDHFYRVRQLHAHTWVEAYLTGERLPPELTENRPLDWSGGGWLRLDPTPPAGLIASTRLMEGMQNWVDWLQFVWSDYVIGMNSLRQRELIYQPVAGWLRQMGRRLASRRWWGRLLRNLASSWRARAPTWLAWGAALAASAAVLVLTVRYAGRRFRLRGWRLGRTRRGGSPAQGGRAQVEFYVRLERLLARLGLARARSQTQRDFARQGGTKIAESTGEGDLARLPIQVAEAFYCVRFGGRRLDGPQATAVRRALDRLERAADGRSIGRARRAL